MGTASMVGASNAYYAQGKDASGGATQTKASSGAKGVEGAGYSNNVDDLAVEIKDWLGKDAKTITNQSGEKVFISQDGLRKVRFDINNPSPHNSPHVHFEQLINGKWKPLNPAIHRYIRTTFRTIKLRRYTMRILDEITNKSLTNITILLKKSELTQLIGYLEELNNTPHEHYHLNNGDYSKEIMVAVYDIGEPLNLFSDRYKKLILSDE